METKFVLFLIVSAATLMGSDNVATASPVAAGNDSLPMYAQGQISGGFSASGSVTIGMAPQGSKTSTAGGKR
ncbi:unnamed protein product [Phyllotreta striolata]|uniref:Uncharacterized protein n=1 Tax=Phyllotreta striolata TaxID=444603 RepID=A0A9N9TSK2_PHYSR|nr:unnamed protein product [Phyllotreta striolata]